MHQETFNQLFTMHGTIMLLMFATPLFSGFANFFMPLQIGAPDVAFRLKCSTPSFLSL
jgi:cytochrome c oxidase subunit 1